jgi:glycosyltransferase involved in cell wall biosynthesis
VRDCEHWYGRQATTVTNCYDVPRGHRADPNGVVLWVSALRTGKRPELFLELARRLPHLRFRMVGGPSGETAGDALFEQIKEQAREIPNLEFVGFVPFAEIDPHFNAARVFVNTSDFEGFPNTFLQSWSRRIPTVSFCDTGSRFNGEQVVTVADDLNDMTVLVDRLMHENVFWQTSGSRASSCYEKFHTPDAVMDSYERVFTGLWQSRSETLPLARRPRFESMAMPISDHGKGRS